MTIAIGVLFGSPSADHVIVPVAPVNSISVIACLHRLADIGNAHIRRYTGFLCRGLDDEHRVVSVRCELVRNFAVVFCFVCFGECLGFRVVGVSRVTESGALRPLPAVALEPNWSMTPSKTVTSEELYV